MSKIRRIACRSVQYGTAKERHHLHYKVFAITVIAERKCVAMVHVNRWPLTGCVSIRL